MKKNPAIKIKYNELSTAISLEVKVPENMSEGCFINTTNYLSQFNINQDNETIFVFSFRCHKVRVVQLNMSIRLECVKFGGDVKAREDMLPNPEQSEGSFE
jgi:hypothetical protein